MVAADFEFCFLVVFHKILWICFVVKFCREVSLSPHETHRFHVQRDYLRTETICAQVICKARHSVHRFLVQKDYLCIDSM